MNKVILINGNDKQVIHHYNNSPDAPKLLEGTIKEGVNSVPSFTFSIDYTHKNFNDFVPYISHVQVLNDKEEELFFGRLITPSNALNDGIKKTLVFEGRMGYLNDSVIRPKEWHDYTVKNFIKEVLQEHNNQVEDYKKIYPGVITVEDNLYRMANNDQTLQFILDRLPNRLGGFMSVRNENGVNYLDYLLDTGIPYDKPVIFGYNMIDFSKDETPPIGTVLIPLGKNINDGTAESEVGNNVTINSVNNGKDYIENAEAIKKYGRITVTNTWDDVEEPSILLSKGREYLNEIIKPKQSITLTWADMDYLDMKEVNHYIGDFIRVKCPPFNIDEDYRIIEKTIDLFGDITKNSYTFGNKIGNLTDRQIIIENAQKRIDGFFNEKGLNSNFLEGTINLLKNNMRGMVDNAKNHQDKAILFECDIPGEKYGAMALGTKGFMIADKKINNEWNWRTFGTGQGFTADLITAGILCACSIISLDGSVNIDLKNGTFKIGGNDSNNCVEHTNKYSKWIHKNGEYTEANSKGFFKNGREYLTNIYADSGVLGGSAGVYPESKTIQLPDSFKGHTFKVIANTTDTAGGLENEYMKRIYLKVDNYDYTNATFRITGYWLAVDKNDRENKKELTYSYIAIGG